MQLLVCLGAAHVLGDFLLQSEHTARHKQRPWVLARHALVVAGLSYLLCGAWRAWFVFVAVFVAHALIDAFKARLGRSDLSSLVIDQFAHAASLVFIAYIVARQDLDLFGVDLFGVSYLKLLVVAGGVVLALPAGGVLISLAVAPLLEELRAAAGSDASLSPESRGFEHGGKIIGQLERGLILLFALTGQPGGIGFLIAAKSIFRFGELKEHQHRMEAEYIIIGTMMSFGYGLLVAYLMQYLLQVVAQ